MGPQGLPVGIRGVLWFDIKRTVFKLSFCFAEAKNGF